MTRKKTPALSHVDAAGRARMVDVSGKAATARQAVARGHIALNAAARRAVRSSTLGKGDAIAAARLAGVMAAKRTSELIPLCHPLPLTHVDVEIDAVRDGYAITATARTTGPTGVEMEALTAVAVAALTMYDMVKAVDQHMTIGRIHLIEKAGGTRDFRR